MTPPDNPTTDPEDQQLGVLWTWSPGPSTEASAPPSPEAPSPDPVVPEAVVPEAAPLAPAAPVGVLWSWTPPPAPEPAPGPESYDPHPTVRRRAPVLDPSKRLPTLPPLAPPIFFDAEDEQYWSDLRAARRRRRTLRLGFAGLLVAACAGVPWVAPQVPSMFADAVPAPVATTADPTVAPPSTVPGSVLRPVPGVTNTRLAAAGPPLEVVVPRLHVRSAVVPISGQSGELVPPSNPQLLGWWQEGRGVGSAYGSAVVTGHTVSTGGGAFDHLGELVPGDRIRVRTAAGAVDYVVRESRDVPVAELARTAASIFRLSGPGRLVLITCSDFNGQVYLSNSVVYAAPVKDLPRR